MTPLAAMPWQFQAAAILFLCGLQFLCWWWAVRLINWSTRQNVSEQIDIIKKDPVATAIYRAAIICSAAYLVTGAWGRFIG